MVTLEVINGDITKIRVDAIVNAANSSLLGGGGVDGAIHRIGGPTILEECKKIVATNGPCPTGEAVITSAGNLNAKFIIHSVGPVWHGGTNNEEQQLANCYQNSLQLAIHHKCSTIAYPNISTGIYRFPKKTAAEIAVNTVSTFLNKNEIIKTIFFVCFDDENYTLYEQLLDSHTE